MYFFEHLIKLLLSNSNTLFFGLIIVIFGYYGWLLFNINNQLRTSTFKWDKIYDRLKDILNKLEKIDELYYKELPDKLNENRNLIKELNTCMRSNNIDLEKLENKIIAEVKEESSEIKERMKILVGRTRGKINQDKEDKTAAEDVEKTKEE